MVKDNISTVVASWSRVIGGPVSDSSMEVTRKEIYDGPRFHNSNDYNVFCASYFSDDDDNREDILSISTYYSSLNNFYPTLISFARKFTNAYVSSPALLCILPLIVGLSLGYLIGFNNGKGTKKDKPTENRKSTPSTKEFTSKLFQFFSVASLFEKVYNYTRIAQNNTSTLVWLICMPILRIYQSIIQITYIKESLTDRENTARQNLRSDLETKRESGVPDKSLPRHIAVIMDGNRRYGKEKYGNSTQVRMMNCLLIYFVPFYDWIKFPIMYRYIFLPFGPSLSVLSSIFITGTLGWV